MHRTARLSEIDGLESRRRPSDGPKMPLGFLNEVEQRVAVLDRSWTEPPRARSRARQARRPNGSDGGRRLSARAGFSGRRPLRECVRERLPQARSRRSRGGRRSYASAGSPRAGSDPGARDHAEARLRTCSARAGRPDSKRAFLLEPRGASASCCAALLAHARTLGPAARGRAASLDASNDGPCQAFGPTG